MRTKEGAKQRYRAIDMGDPEAVRRRQDSANRVLGMLMAALNLAVTEEKAPAGPWRYVLPFKDVARSRLRYLTVAECKRLLNACDPEFRNLVHALLLTGCRYQEIARLRVQDFNPDARTLHIQLSKSGNARHVALTGRRPAFLRPTRCWSRWPRTHVGPLLGQVSSSEANGGGLRTCRHRSPVGLHQLRHTFASLSVMNGTPLIVVANALGHADTRMVEKHYGHLSQSYLAEAIRKGAPRFGRRSLQREGAMRKPFNQHLFPRLHVEGKEKGNDKGLNLRAKTPEHRKIVERRFARALGFKINNPDATDYQIAKYLRETEWPTKQRTADAAVRRWKKLPDWINKLKARGIPT